MLKIFLFFVPTVSQAAAINQTDISDIALVVGCALMMALGLLMGK